VLKTPYFGGLPWTYERVSEVLTNPKYAGFNVWGRTTQSLTAKQRVPSSELQVCKRDAFAPVVSPALFESVQKARQKSLAHGLRTR